MDARRMVAYPRPCSGPRLVAKMRRRGGFVNSVTKLQAREISSRSSRGFSFAEERFRNFYLQEEYYIEEEFPPSILFLNMMSTIIEVVATNNVVFALYRSGVCVAFSRETKEKICFLNVSPDEVILRLFYNERNDSLITLVVCASDGFKSLICRTTSIEYIRRGEPDAGFNIFESESMKWPCFVEFDDVSGKIITYCAKHEIFKVFDLKNYAFLYSILVKNIQDIKLSPGSFLLLYERIVLGIPLEIVSVEDGTVVRFITQFLHKNKEIVLVQQFNEKLLVKQEDENLQIVDVPNSQITEVQGTEFLSPFAVIPLYTKQLFLTFINHTATLWNLKGELVTTFEDCILRHPDYNSKSVCVTTNGDLIICYCKADADESSSDGKGFITINNILTGKCVGKITANNAMKGTQGSKIRSSITEALEDISILFYDEEHNELYTANRFGRVHVWTN